MRIILLCLLWSLTAPALAIGVGVVSQIQGEAQLQRADEYLAAAEGVEVLDDDIIETGANASIQLDMNDGTVLRLGADTRLLLAAYRLDDRQNMLAASLEVLSGWLRFAVAKMHNTDSQFDISTPTMTIGIRGTEGVIQSGNDSGSLLLEEGAVRVRAAEAGVIPLNAGEYVERVHGRPFHRPAAVPGAFRARLPALLRARNVRRAHLLQQRGVPPRVIRRLQREDRQRFLNQHPHLRQRLEQRFRDRQPGALRLRERLEQRQQQLRQDQRQLPRRRPADGGPDQPRQR